MSPFQRIAITVPPDAWFHGIARSLFDLYRQAFLDLGLAVFDVPVDAFVDPGTGRLSAVLDDLRAFQPDVAFGLSHGLYALLCRLPARRDGWRANAFTELLDIPTICLWDHAPLELADQILKPHPLDPAASHPDALDTLRRVLTHPRLIHLSRDSGQTRIMQDLGLLLADRLIQEITPALPGFLPQSTPGLRPPGTAFGAGFVGHFYQEPPDYPHPLLAELAEDSMRTWLDGESLPLWDVLMGRIAAMPAALREPLALVPQQTYFWPFVHRLILQTAQTSRRLKLLGAAGIPVACYGDLSAGLPGVPANLASIKGHIPFGPELAATLARHPLTIDVLNPGFIHGYSHKVILGFASGGFVLLDRKQDFVDAFGEAGEAASYRGADDLGAKVDHFLSHPNYRREVGDTIRHKIASRFQLKDVLARVLDAASRCPAAAGGPPHSTRYFDIRRRSTTVQHLLPLLRSEPHWTGARVQHLEDGALIVTPPEAWQYTAAVPIPPLDAMNEPHLRLRFLVETGRIGLLAICDDTGVPCGEEQFVGPHIRPVHVTVELPRLGPTTVILRNTVEGESRAVILEADLCDRHA